MVEGKLRLLSQCSSAFLAAIDAAISSITTTNFQVLENTDANSNAAINVKATGTNKAGILHLTPSGTSTASQIILNTNPTIDAAKVFSIQGFDTGGYIALLGADLSDALILEVTGNAGQKLWTFAQTGATTFPSKLVNTAIADPAAAAGQMWLSSTNVDNLKYSSASTLYTIHSTKAAIATNTAAAPTVTGSATAVMMACGGAITPLNTGRILITISGQMNNDTINDGATVDLRYGTGTPPVNGAAVTGTLVGVAQTATSLVAAQRSGFCISGVVSGLTLGTAVWIDASLMRVTGGNAGIFGVTISAVEI